MNLESSLGQGLSYLGTVDGARQRYFIFEASDTFMVFSLSNVKLNSGNFSLVSRKAVEYIHRKLCGQKEITSHDVVEQSKRTKHAPTTLLALNVLYVLVAQKRACIDGIGSHSKLYFNILDADVRATVRKKAARKVKEKKAARKVARKVRKKTAHRVKKKSAVKKKEGKPAVRVHNGKRYKRYIVETFLPYGEQSTSEIRVRPVAGQGLSKKMRVKCGKPFRARYAIGTRFRMWAMVSDREGGTPFLYSPYGWMPEVL